MNETFTLTRAHFRIGLVATCVSVSMLTFDVLGMYAIAPDGKKLLAAVCTSIPCLVFVGMSVWQLLAYSRASVCVDGDLVTVTGVLWQRRFRISEVLRARWHWPRPALKMSSCSGKTALWFELFRPDQQARLIRYLRDHLPPQVQIGWNDDLGRYADECCRDQTTAEFDAFVHGILRLVRRASMVGPVLGIGFGLINAAAVANWGARDVPTWTGSVVLDGLLIGIIAGLLVLVMLEVVFRGLKWVFQPEW